MNSSHAHHAGRAGRTSSAKGARRFSGRRHDDLSIDQMELIPGSMNDGMMVRSILKDAMDRSGLSRAQIADRMSFLYGAPVTERMLNNFSAESRDDYRWPAELDRAFCAVVKDDRLMTARAEAYGLHVIDETGWQLLELGRQTLIHERAQARIAQLKSELEGAAL